jgi:chromosome transmission fidelity protein 1
MADKVAPDWVIAQTRERHLQEFEADEKEYEERLANARKKEAAMRKKAMARVTKKTVWLLSVRLPLQY